ncbi:hypothetical protein P7H59_06765 [Enterococcus viikkiensis]|uniref:Uncharacterized protein n=1 Tax=Enterococcus viikkiensis TaxID=930854 RepID=A0ABU3FR84_9ENTE|nr:hypothetical protein [Enterococcus viikkiensis]MDT2828158.1 hypothetical protein [Enterococcus viikkiensis]
MIKATAGSFTRIKSETLQKVQIIRASLLSIEYKNATLKKEGQWQ